MLVDHHCHLDFPQFAADRAGLVARAKAAGVVTMVTISTRIRRFEEIKAIAESHPDIWCSVGTHPHQADEERGITTAEIVKLAQHPKVVAIGEAGLDYFYKHGTPAARPRASAPTSRRRARPGCRWRSTLATPTRTRSRSCATSMQRGLSRRSCIALPAGASWRCARWISGSTCRFRAW